MGRILMPRQLFVYRNGDSSGVGGMLEAFESAGVMDPAWKEKGKPIPWKVHVLQLEKAKTDPEAAFYIQFLTWSRGCAPTVFGKVPDA